MDRQWGYAAPGLAKTGRCTTDTRLMPTLTLERPVSKTPALGEKKEPQPGPQHPRVLSPFSLTSLVIASDSSCECVSSMTDTGILIKSSSEKLYIKDTIKSNIDNTHDDNSLTLRAYSVSDTEHTARLISCSLV